MPEPPESEPVSERGAALDASFDAIDDSFAALRATNTWMAEFVQELKQTQRQGAAEAKAGQQSVRRWLLVAIAATILSGVMAATTDNTWLRVMWTITGNMNALSCGANLAVRRNLRMLAEAAEPCDSPVDTPKRLARLNEKFGAYPHLWPASATVIAATIGGAAVVLAAVLTLIAS